MSGTPSESAVFSAVTQSSKGTAETTGFVTGLLEQSAVNFRGDPMSQVPEHGLGSGFATAKKSPSRYGTYAVTGSARSVMYLDLVGHLLQGAGFTAAAATGAGTDKTHVFQLSARDAQLWLSLLWEFGTAEKLVTDARVTRLAFEASADALKYTATILGLKLTDSAGTETVTAEDVDSECLPSLGSLTFTPTAGTGISAPTTSIQRTTIDIQNPLDENDRALFTYARADLPQTGLRITGKIDGFDMDYDVYDTLIRANQSSGEPSQDTCLGTLAIEFQSAGHIGATSTHYSIKFEFDQVEVTLDDFAAEGANLVRWNTSWEMVDSGQADTVKVTIVSAKASFVPA